MKKLLILGILACSLLAIPAQAAEDAQPPKSVDFSFEGPSAITTVRPSSAACRSTRRSAPRVTAFAFSRTGT